jgi:hypothetical protein
VLVAVADATAAMTLSALLMTCGVAEIGTACTPAEAADALEGGMVDLVLVDHPIAAAAGGRPSVLVLGPDEAPDVAMQRIALRLPITAAGLAAAMSAALASDDRSEPARTT